tara:strand:+ start:299 stop:1183 length:885 start_codon:yes stop_codon:yes gene_type:complete
MDPVTGAMILGGAKIGGNLLSGFLGGRGVDASARTMLRAQREKQDFLNQAYDDARGLYNPIYQQGMEGFNRLSQGVLSGEFDRPDMPQFQYDKGVSDFLDPSRQFQQEEVMKALEGSQAFGGKLKSGPAMMALQDRLQDRSMLDYGNAYNRMTGDRNFSYQDYTNQFNNTINQVNDRYNKLSALANQGTSSANTLANLRMGQGHALGETAVNMGDIRAQQAQIPYLQGQNMVGALQDTTGLVLGGLSQRQPETPNIPDPNMGLGVAPSGVGMSLPSPQMGMPYSGMPVKSGNLS